MMALGSETDSMVAGHTAGRMGGTTKGSGKTGPGTDKGLSLSQRERDTKVRGRSDMHKDVQANLCWCCGYAGEWVENKKHGVGVWRFVNGRARPGNYCLDTRAKTIVAARLSFCYVLKAFGETTSWWNTLHLNLSSWLNIDQTDG